MGRKPKALKQEERPHGTTTTTTTNKKNEKKNPSVEGVELNPQSNNTNLEPANMRPEIQDKSGRSYSKIMEKKNPGKVRRSERLQNAVTLTENRDVERVIEEMVISESEQEEEPVDGKLSDPVDEKVPEPNWSEKKLEEKVDYLLQIWKAQQKSIDDLRSKATKKNLFPGSSDMRDATYKSLYIESQKKVEALTEENLRLVKQLENALGKIEVFEKGKQKFCEVLEMKDVILFSSTTKATEAAVNISSEAVRGAFTLDTDLEFNHATNKRKRSDEKKQRN